MNKTTAAAIINRKGIARLDANHKGNVTWANINSSKEVWWADIPVKKFTDDFHLILNDRINRLFHLVSIPRGTFPTPYNTFRKKGDGYISIELSSKDRHKFIDVKSGGTRFDFKKFEITTINYKADIDKETDRT